MFDFSIVTWLLIILVVYLIYLACVKPFLYWVIRRVPGPTALPFIGLNYAFFKPGLLERGLEEVFHEMISKYHKRNLKYYGSFSGATPELMIFDPDLIKQVVLEDFNSFQDRPKLMDIKPFDDTVLAQVGEHWKHTRSYLSPAFSTAKIKRMFPIIQQCCQCFVEVVQEKSNDAMGITVKDVTENLTMDIMGRAFFGIDANSQENPHSAFVKNCKAITLLDFINPLLFLTMMFPFLGPIFKGLGLFSVHDPEVYEYIESIVNQAFEDRKLNSNVEYSKDFLQSMVQAEVSDKTTEKISANGKIWNSAGLTKQDIMGNAYGMIIAGTGTTSDTISSVLFSLALNQDCQEQLYQEIIENFDEEPDYDTVLKLEYLDMVINESLRINPSAILLTRLCTADTKLGDLVIEKGVNINMPMIYIQRHPDFWPEPEKFIPERFSPENKPHIHPGTFSPFGAGQRNCVGMRFALIEVKMVIVYVVKNFAIEKAIDTPDKLKYSFRGARPFPFNLKFVPRH